VVVDVTDTALIEEARRSSTQDSLALDVIRRLADALEAAEAEREKLIRAIEGESAAYQAGYEDAMCDQTKKAQVD
jgi:hypothetical protein